MSSATLLHVAAGSSLDMLAFLGPAMRELEQCGVHQTLLHAGPVAAVPESERVRCITLDRRERPDCWACLRALRAALRLELAAQSYRAVHLHGAGAAWAARPVLGRGGERRPVFYSPHGLPGSHGWRALADASALLAERLAGTGRLQLVGCSGAEVRQLAALGGLESTLLCPPVDPRLFALVRRRAVPPTVLCLGDACTARAPEQFAELAARFCFAGESARFVWVGAGPPHYERLLRAAGVTLAGWGSAATVADMLAGAAVVVLTGREHGAPRVLAQAMASAAPIVAMNLPCHRELVRHDATALLADELSELALHVKALIDDRQRAEALGVAARAEARRRFPPERFPQALLDLYRLPGGGTAIPAAHDAVPRFDAAAP